LHVATTSDLFPRLHPDFPAQHLASMSLAHSSQVFDSQATSNARQTTPEIIEHRCLITTLPHSIMLVLALNGCTQDVNTLRSQHQVGYQPYPPVADSLRGVNSRIFAERPPPQDSTKVR